MEKKKDNHFVKIDSDFLFDSNKVFKSRHTPWIYLYLKLEYNYYIQRLPNKAISLKSGEIAKFFHIDRATVHRCIKELMEIGVIIRNERDSYIVCSERGKYNEGSKSNYLEVYKNLLINVFKNGGNIDDAKVYYFMIQNNRHYAFESNNLKSDLTQTKISRKLSFDSRKTKVILEKLLNLGLITIDNESKKYMTTYLRGENTKINIIVNQTEKANKKPVENEYHSVNYNKIINDFLECFKEKGEDIPIQGWFKTKDGYAETPIIKIPEYGYVVDESRARESNGIPPSDEQMKMQIKMVTDNLNKKMCVIH